MDEVMFIELGMGVDLQGQDATKAAVRAVRDAIGRNYLPAVRRALEGGGRMLVRLRLGVPEGVGPVDVPAVRAAFPYGEVEVEIAPGGLLVPNGHADGGTICVVNAAIEVGIAS